MVVSSAILLINNSNRMELLSSDGTSEFVLMSLFGVFGIAIFSIIYNGIVFWNRKS